MRLSKPDISRRGFLSGLSAALALPAVVKADSLMRCVGERMVILPSPRFVGPGLVACDGSLIDRTFFPELAAVLGNSGFGRQAPAGYARLPDLRSDFLTYGPDAPKRLCFYAAYTKTTAAAPVGTIVNILSQPITS